MSGHLNQPLAVIHRTSHKYCVNLVIDSVPDLRDYSVQVGLRHLNESSSRPRLRISRLICGPDGSNLVMLKLAE